MRRTKILKAVILYPLFILIGLTILFPIFWMIYSSLKSATDIFGNVFALPTTVFTGNYTTVFTTGGMGTYFKNSLIVTVASVAGLLLFTSLAAYAFATFRFRGKTALFLFMLVGLMVPAQSLIISGFKWMSILHMLSKYWALIFTYFGWISFGVLVLRDFFEGVPREIKDAARIDGASHLQMFARIMVPLARPSMATIAIFYFMWVWNDFLYPLVYMQTQTMYTIPLGVLFFNARYTVDWGLQMAALTIATVPPLLIYLFFQRQFVRGILAGAIKG